MTNIRPSELQQPDPLAVEDFERYFRVLNNHDPFQWQIRLAERVCRGDWPDFIKLPTASGKTAAIDIAIFALAFQAAAANRPGGALTAARRIFFVVDRRIIVNEAYRRARKAAKRLREILADSKRKGNYIQPGTDKAVLLRVAQSLQYLAGDPMAPPLDCFELRGGIYRDDAWVRSPLQPTVITSTVDQVGSRLLFRGYGVSDRNLPIHAALTANDSLIFLDGAHCSKPFSQTVQAVKRYRSEHWAQDPIVTPFSFVQMTATPPADLAQEQLFELNASDYERDPPLVDRHHCNKPVELDLVTGAKGSKLSTVLAKKLVEHAMALANKYGLRKVAIVVNRVAVARKAFDLLNDKHRGQVSLMIGRMRPLDRDGLTKELQREFASDNINSPSLDALLEPKFVVATQCLEVGADLDFDGMVSQCASLDALRQRFGRLNRMGKAPNARGVIVAAEGDVQPLDKLSDDKPLDPIYGNALARTWHWLKAEAGVPPQDGDNAAAPTVDFGVQALEGRCNALEKRDFSQMLAPTQDAPTLMPAHLDMLCQTAPRPALEPNVAAYLHGPNRDSPEVRVCWRADLETTPGYSDKRLEEAWFSAVEVCPPSSAECLSVPLDLFRKWLRSETVVDDTGDVLGEMGATPEKDPKERRNVRRAVLVWHGKGSQENDRQYIFTRDTAEQVRPNETVVIPAEFGGWHAFALRSKRAARSSGIARLFRNERESTESPDARQRPH